MNSPSSIPDELRSRAANGASAPALVRWLQEYLAPNFSVFDFVRYFSEAFRIPLETLRDSEAWVGFSPAGTLSDREFDQLLRPWFERRE